MPTTTFEVEEYDLAVEPWGPIKRRIVLRGPKRRYGGRDEATLLFAAERTETGVAYHVDDDGRGTAVWAYFDDGDYGDVRHIVERGTPPYLHYGYTSGTGTTRTLYFVSVETSASVSGTGRDPNGDGESDSEESMSLDDAGSADGERSADDEAFGRIDGRNAGPE